MTELLNKSELKVELCASILSLNKVEEQIDNFIHLLSELDKKEEDIKHYLETHTFSTSGAYSLMREFQKTRKKRREVKQMYEIYRTYGEHKNKLLNHDNRTMLIAEINKKDKQLDSKYNYQVYTEKMLDIISKNVKKEESKVVI